MLLEDQYGVGDVINIGDSTTGTVEAVGQPAHHAAAPQT